MHVGQDCISICERKYFNPALKFDSYFLTYREGCDRLMGNRPDEIAEIVLRAILEKRLWPGRKLSEQTLADIFGVSRAVVRQAIIRLADDGLVVVERNRGAFVSRPSYREATEIYDAITMLEQGVIAQLAGRMDARGWEELRRQVKAQQKAVDDKNNALADELGAGFHEVLVSLSHNRVVQELHAQLIRRTALLRTLVDSRFDYCGLLHDHCVLIDLMEEGKVKKAQDLIEVHHRNVVRGYVLDETASPPIRTREALAPYATEMTNKKIAAH